MGQDNSFGRQNQTLDCCSFQNHTPRISVLIRDISRSFCLIGNYCLPYIETISCDRDHMYEIFLMMHDISFTIVHHKKKMVNRHIPARKCQLKSFCMELRIDFAFSCLLGSIVAKGSHEQFTSHGKVHLISHIPCFEGNKHQHVNFSFYLFFFSR